jgi:hypothetical protein
MATKPLRRSLDPASFESKGKRQNLNGVFQVPLMGHEIYDILQVLESHAVNNPCYLQVSAAVLAAEGLREAARTAGW